MNNERLSIFVLVTQKLESVKHSEFLKRFLSSTLSTELQRPYQHAKWKMSEKAIQ